MLRNVFVETNWVVACAAPAHLRLREALELMEMARVGEIRLHVPSICISEARHPIRSKYQPRPAADSIRKYLAWATAEERWDPKEIELLRRALDRYEGRVAAELDRLDATLDELCTSPGVEFWPLCSCVRANLQAVGNVEFCFCELDGDLQPWDKNGRSKRRLAELYEKAGIWVSGDFSMKNPERRTGWPFGPV